MHTHRISGRNQGQAILASMTAVFLLVAAIGRAETGSQKTNNFLTALQRSEPQHLKAVNEARLRFAQERRPVPSHGLYGDFRAQTAGEGLWFPNFGPDGKPIAGSGLRFSEMGTNEILQGVPLSRAGNASSNLVAHILARELTETLIREALTNGRAYAADDWLCDPTGFTFGALNNQGAFTIGDSVATLGKTRVIAVTPLAAKLRLFYNSAMVQETAGTNLIFEATKSGAYRIEAWLMADGEERLWIYSNPVYLRSPDFIELASLLPPMEMSPGVERHPDIIYREGPLDDAPKHKLDVYTPKGKTNAPVLFFIHGGAWKSGDRSYYPPLGNRFAREGYVTVVPSYRLAPKHPHPAQIEDVAAAFAWTARHIAEYGGDTNRIYVAGHSAGGHLAALLSLDEHYLAEHQLSPKDIRGALVLSGVYDLTTGEGLTATFGKNAQARRDASPLFHVKTGAPPFLVTYCQWDYFSLPAQAKDFYQALEKAGARSELVFIPGQSHLSEMFNIWKEKDLTATTVLRFMK